MPKGLRPSVAKTSWPNNLASPFSLRHGGDRILVMTATTSKHYLPSGRLLGRRSLERLLAKRQPTSGQNSSSVFAKPGEAGRYLAESGPEGRDWQARLLPLGDRVLESDTGIAALAAAEQALVVTPPFPLLRNQLSDRWDPSPIMEVLEAEYTVGVVLLRLGRFSVAVYRGETLLSSKTDARYVKGRHHAGGTSQKRFERIREGQIRRIYDKACRAVNDQLIPFAGKLDYILLGGERFTIDGFLKRCPTLEALGATILSRRLNIRDPKRETLEQVSGMLRESRVWTVDWVSKDGLSSGGAP